MWKYKSWRLHTRTHYTRSEDVVGEMRDKACSVPALADLYNAVVSSANCLYVVCSYF